MRTKPKDVAIGTKRGKGWITLSPLPAQPEPKHLPRLKTEILRRWGVVGLLDILKEAAMLTGCLDCFQSTGSREALEHELLQQRLLRRKRTGINRKIQEISGRRSELADPVARSLSRSRRSRLLARGTSLSVHLFSIKVLYLL